MMKDLKIPTNCFSNPQEPSQQESFTFGWWPIIGSTAHASSWLPIVQQAISRKMVGKDAKKRNRNKISQAIQQLNPVGLNGSPAQEPPPQY
jgi:hypothetical protein